MASLIGALRVSLSADTAKFFAGMKGAERQAQKSSSAISKSLGLISAGFKGLAAGLSIGLIARGIKDALEYAGSLAEVAQQLGVTTRQLQVYRYAAGQVGVSQEKLEVGLSKLNITLGKAKLGAAAPAKAFAELSKIIGKDIVASSKQGGDALPLVADGFAKITDTSKKAAIAVTLMGKGGAAMVNLLSGGSKEIDKYAAALENMGGILSDEEIQSADLTADKIEQLNNQLKANIAGAVARNSGAILDLANSLIFLVSKLGKAITAWSDFKNALDAQAFDIASKNPLLSAKKRAEGADRAARARGKISDSGIGWNVGGSKVIIELPPINAPKPKAEGVDVGNFLAGGGKKGPKGKSAEQLAEEAERKRLEALRDAFQFEEEQRRFDMDILRAKQQLATDYVARTALSIQMLNLDKTGFQEELKYRVAAKELTQAQADQLQAKFDVNDALQRQIVLEEEQADRLRDYNHLADLDFDLKRDVLESEAQLAETASERRKAELKLLDLAYRQERARLQAVILEEESKDIAQQNFARLEEARRQLANLNKTEANDRAGVLAGTRGPMEDWLASLPTTAAKTQEAMERLEVEGFEGLIDAALALSGGFDNAKKALLDTLKQFLLGLARMELQKGLASILGSGFKGFASGGFTGNIGRNSIAGFVHGEEGVLNSRAMRTLGVPTLNALNRGVPLSAVSNDNGGGRNFNQTINITTPDANSFRMNERQIARNAKRRLAQV
jgi:hypothetical protein